MHTTSGSRNAASAGYSRVTPYPWFQVVSNEALAIRLESYLQHILLLSQPVRMWVARCGVLSKSDSSDLQSSYRHHVVDSEALFKEQILEAIDLLRQLLLD